MIPKKIHYCWFGRNPLPAKAQKCIASWKTYCPDYELIEWNEDNFDVFLNSYTKQCYEKKKYAFLTDYVRLWVIEQYGGIYFDTDVEVVRSLDSLLDCKGFFGFENNEFVATGLGFGAEPHNPIVQQMIKEYDSLLEEDRSTIGCPILNTQALEKFGLQRNGQYQDLGHAVIYPAEYFNPYDDPTGRLNRSTNTYSIHWYAKTWMDPKTVLRSRLSRPLHRILGIEFFRKRKK